MIKKINKNGTKTYVTFFIYFFQVLQLHQLILLLQPSTSTVLSLTQSQHSSYSYYYVGILLACITSLSVACKIVSRQWLVKTNVPHSIINFQFTAFNSLAWLIYILVRQQRSYDSYRLIIGVGLISGLIHLIVNLFYAQSLKHENVQILCTVGSLDIVYAVLLQWIFLKYSCTMTFFLGATLIVIGSLLACRVKFIGEQ